MNQQDQKAIQVVLDEVMKDYLEEIREIKKEMQQNDENGN